MRGGEHLRGCMLYIDRSAYQCMISGLFSAALERVSRLHIIGNKLHHKVNYRLLDDTVGLSSYTK
jgi:hypothetical protein